MDPAKLARAARPAALGTYLKKTAAVPRHDHGHAGHAVSVRTAEHNGHRITLTTTYRVEIDGRVLKVPLMVDDAGNVHCHSLPTYQFDSALDMIKAVIDLFPEEFAAKPTKRGHAHPPSVAKGRGAGRRKS